MSKKRNSEDGDKESENAGFGMGFMESRNYLDEPEETPMYENQSGNRQDKKRKLKGVKFDKLIEKYGNTDECPLCTIGLYTFETRDIETEIGNLLKNTVFFVSRSAIIQSVIDILNNHRQDQISRIENGSKSIKVLPEVTPDQVHKHLSDHMTEYSWELRTQVDDLRAVIALLKDKIIEVDSETGQEVVNQKNVQLLQVSQANLRKVLVTDVGKSVSFKPEVTYTKAKNTA